MRTFTKTEIDLCKKIAEKGERKKIEWGDWYEMKGNIFLLSSRHNPEMSDITIPLWQEHDCLEWLRKKKYYYAIYYQVGGGVVVDIFKLVDGRRSLYHQIHGKTCLSGLLRAVLAVMEEK